MIMAQSSKQSPLNYSSICSEAKNWRQGRSQNLPGGIQAEITRLLTPAKKHKKRKRFPLTAATCIPPNGCLNTTVCRGTTNVVAVRTEWSGDELTTSEIDRQNS